MSALILQIISVFDPGSKSRDDPLERMGVISLLISLDAELVEVDLSRVYGRM